MCPRLERRRIPNRGRENNRIVQCTTQELFALHHIGFVHDVILCRPIVERLHLLRSNGIESIGEVDRRREFCRRNGQRTRGCRRRCGGRRLQRRSSGGNKDEKANHGPKTLETHARSLFVEQACMIEEKDFTFS